VWRGVGVVQSTRRYSGASDGLASDEGGSRSSLLILQLPTVFTGRRLCVPEILATGVSSRLTPEIRTSLATARRVDPISFAREEMGHARTIAKGRAV